MKEELRGMGSPIPDTTEGKISFIQNLIFNLCNEYSFNILKSASTARNIRDFFISLMLMKSEFLLLKSVNNLNS